MTRDTPSRPPLPQPSPIMWLLTLTLPTIVSVVIWYMIEPMGRIELAVSIAIGVLVSLLIWGALSGEQRQADKRAGRHRKLTLVRPVSHPDRV